MKVGLLNPAPLGPRLTRWGDYRFGNSLAAAFRDLGVQVEQRFWPDWEALGEVDLAITLRGKRMAAIRRGARHALWIISHPSSVSPSEMNSYDFVCLASETHRSRLGDDVAAPTFVLRQCTDDAQFFGSASVEDEARHRRRILFVGNSRGIRRQAVSDMSAAGVPFDIIGRSWRNVGLQHRVVADYVADDDLRRTYAGCRAALNDHWTDMKFFGVINNRVLDCLACGTPVISDTFPELRETFGPALLYIGDNGATAEAMETLCLDYHGLLRRIRAYWRDRHHTWTFRARAEAFLEHAGAPALRGWAPAAWTPPREVPQVARAIDRIKSAKGDDATVQVLHVAPSAELRYWLSAREDVDLITGGFEPGPVSVELQPDLGNLPKRRFDLVVLDGVSPREVPWSADALNSIRRPDSEVIALMD